MEKSGKEYFVCFAVISFIILCPNYADSRCIKGNCKNGHGVFIWGSGARYEGEWKKGERNGKGTLIYADGSRHIGRWKDGKPWGYGKFISFYGIIYIGKWEGYYINGKGSVIYENGSKYRGTLVRGKRHGYGVMYDINGKELYRGKWENDVFIGK